MNKRIKYIVLVGIIMIPAGIRAQNIADTAKVNIAFRQVCKKDLMGGISAINIEDLNKKSFGSNDLQAFVGGYDGELWNQGDALILVDGVPRDNSYLPADEIEQITFMKAASAVALYGSRGAKGVILVTTKRGHTDGLQINARGNANTFVPKYYPKYLGAAQYMSLYNEALANDGKTPVYSEENIYNYASGRNPFRYPDINFFSKDYLKKSYQSYDADAEFSGGGHFAHFYTNIGFSSEGDLVKFGEGKHNNTNLLNIRGNVDLRLNDMLTAWVDANVIFHNARNDNSNFWSSSATLCPTSQYPLTPLIPLASINPDIATMQDLISNSDYIIDGKYLLGGTQSYQTNPFASMYAAGYSTTTTRQMQFDAGINMDLNKILRGLSFKSQFAVDYTTSYITSINNDYASYEAKWGNVNGKDEIIGLTKYGTDKRTGIQNVSASADTQTIFFSGQFDYNRQFGLHGIQATLLAHGYQINKSGSYHNTSNANLGLDINYNFAQKYYVECTMAGVHSAKLAPGHRNAISPSVSLAWRLKNESWLKNINWINDLKLNTSYSLLNQDIDISDYYMYNDYFTATGTWWGWSESANSMQTSDSQRGGNENLTFVKRKEFRVGLDANLFHNSITLDANFFNTATDGLVTTPTTIYPSYFKTYYPVSSFLPYINYDNNRRTGFDFTVNGKKDIGEFKLALGISGMTYTSKNTRVDENVQYDWLKSKGASISAIRGYQCIGFFKDENDIKNSAVINSNTKPGDLKYKDQNGDGIIDSKDQVVLGDWTPDFYLGVNFTANYKGFTLFINGTGNFGATAIKNNSYEWVYGNSKYSDVVLGRWTPATATTATYPRLTTEGGELNFVTSDFWTYKTDAFYINKIQLTYDFADHLFKNKCIKGLSVYVSGNSLLTIAKEHKYMETNVGSSPQCRYYNLGVKVNF